MREAAAFLIGAGYGCDAVHEGEPRDPAIGARMIFTSMAVPAEFRARYRKVWGID